MHRVPDHALVTPELLARLGNEASQGTRMEIVDGKPVRRAIPGPFAAVMETGDCQPLRFGSGPASCTEQVMFADAMVTGLNRHLHHDGCWLISYCNPNPAPIVLASGTEYGRFVIMWMDADGDVQFPIECDRPFEMYLLEGPNAMIEKCEKAWQTWKLYMRTVLDPKPTELYKKALGEKPVAIT